MLQSVRGGHAPSFCYEMSKVGVTTDRQFYITKMQSSYIVYFDGQINCLVKEIKFHILL